MVFVCRIAEVYDYGVVEHRSGSFGDALQLLQCFGNQFEVEDFLEAGKKRLAGDVAREATSDEVKGLRAEARQLKEALAEATLENRLLKKSVLADGEDIA